MLPANHAVVCPTTGIHLPPRTAEEDSAAVRRWRLFPVITSPPTEFDYLLSLRMAYRYFNSIPGGHLREDDYAYLPGVWPEPVRILHRDVLSLALRGQRELPHFSRTPDLCNRRAVQFEFEVCVQWLAAMARLARDESAKLPPEPQAVESPIDAAHVDVGGALEDMPPTQKKLFRRLAPAGRGGVLFAELVEHMGYVPGKKGEKALMETRGRIVKSGALDHLELSIETIDGHLSLRSTAKRRHD